MSDAMDDLEFHTCKGSQAIAEETLESVNDDAHAAVCVLMFAACIAAEIGSIPVQFLADQIKPLSRAARTLLGKTDDFQGRLS